MAQKPKVSSILPSKSELNIDYQLLVEAIDALGRYTNKVRNRTNLEDFARFILAERPTEAQYQPREDQPIEVEITIKLFFMFRFARLYSKQRPNEKELPIDEFTYLIPLFYRSEGLHKMHLVELNKQEKTTGVEIINRLIGKGHIEQKPDEKDKRAKKLFISASGRELLIRHLQDFTQLGYKVAEPLSQDEKHSLLALLEKLFSWHNERL